MQNCMGLGVCACARERSIAIDVENIKYKIQWNCNCIERTMCCIRLHNMHVAHPSVRLHSTVRPEMHYTDCMRGGAEIPVIKK